jgi:uncharacterized membrane protein
MFDFMPPGVPQKDDDRPCWSVTQARMIGGYHSMRKIWFVVKIVVVAYLFVQLFPVILWAGQQVFE